MTEDRSVPLPSYPLDADIEERLAKEADFPPPPPAHVIQEMRDYALLLQDPGDLIFSVGAKPTHDAIIAALLQLSVRRNYLASTAALEWILSGDHLRRLSPIERLSALEAVMAALKKEEKMNATGFLQRLAESRLFRRIPAEMVWKDLICPALPEAIRPLEQQAEDTQVANDLPESIPVPDMKAPPGTLCLNDDASSEDHPDTPRTHGLPEVLPDADDEEGERPTVMLPSSHPPPAKAQLADQTPLSPLEPVELPTLDPFARTAPVAMTNEHKGDAAPKE